MKDAAVNPTITVTAANIDFDVMMNNSANKTFKVTGTALTDDVTLTLNDPNGVFTIDPTTVSASDATYGMTINVTFTPIAITDYHATITLSSDGAEDVTVHLTGHGRLEGYTPVMLPADSAYINLTQFRADWTDRTPAENLASYTLEVSKKPAVEFLGSVVGSDYPGNYAEISLTEPWGGNGLMGGNNAVYFFNSGNINFTIPAGYNNETFTLKLTTVSHAYGVGNISVSTPQTAAVEHHFTQGETYSWLVTASTGDMITITTTDTRYSPDIALIEVYSGDVTMRATEAGDATYRLITDITDRFYLVKDLEAAGTFQYKVKAIYTDGTESDWSNIEIVKLFENSHAYELGDVNHDGLINVTDVTLLISYLMGGTVECCEICGDINHDSLINVTDVTSLINIVLDQ